MLTDEDVTARPANIRVIGDAHPRCDSGRPPFRCRHGRNRACGTTSRVSRLSHRCGGVARYATELDVPEGHAVSLRLDQDLREGITRVRATGARVAASAAPASDAARGCWIGMAAGRLAADRRNRASGAPLPRSPAMAWDVALRGAFVLALVLPAIAGCDAAREIDASMRRIDVLDRIFEPTPEPAPQLVLQVVPAQQPPPRPVPSPGLAKDPEPAPGNIERRALEPAAVAPPASIETAALPPVEAQARPDPAVRRAALIRDNPWLTQFWSELSPGEQARVTRAMQRSGTVVGTGPIPSSWDRMGLADRVRLVFGDG